MLFGMLLSPWPCTALHFGLANAHTFRVAHEFRAFRPTLLRHALCLRNLTLAKRTAATSGPTYVARFALATLLCGARTPLRRLHGFSSALNRKSLAFCSLLYPWPATYFGFASFSTLAVAYELWACLFALLRYTGCLRNLTLAKRTTAASGPTHFARFTLATLLRGARTPLFGARLLRNFILLLFNKNTNVRKLWITFLSWPQGIKMDLWKKPMFIHSGDTWMYPDPNVPLCEIPIWALYSGYLWVTPRIPREHNKQHGYTVRSTPNCPLIHTI